MFKTFPAHVARAFIACADMQDALNNSLCRLSSRQIALMKASIADADKRARDMLESANTHRYESGALIDALKRERDARKIAVEQTRRKQRANRAQALAQALASNEIHERANFA